MPNAKRTAAETVHTFMKYILLRKFDEAEKMIIGDVEAMNLPTAEETESLVYSIVEAEEEGEGGYEVQGC